MMGPDEERPWWLRLDGVPPSWERRDRERWPDWDQISGHERVRRRRKRMREWMVDHRWLVLAFFVLIVDSAIRNFISMFTTADEHVALAMYHGANVVIALLAGWWWVREFRRGVRGE